MLFAYTAIEGLHMKQFDVKTAFLYGELEEQVYLEPPQGFQTKNQVWKLNRSLYGLKQAPRQWNKRFTQFMKNQRLNQSSHEECIFYRTNPFVIIIIYVDDGIIFARDEHEIKSLITKLKNEFEMNDIETNTFLGFEYLRKSKYEICIHQTGYIKRILEKFDMINSKTTDTPRAVSQCNTNDQSLNEITTYRSIVGSLL